MEPIKANININKQLIAINPETCPSASPSTLKIFNEKGHTAPKSLSTLKGKVETLATTEGRLQWAKQSQVVDRILSVLKLAAAVSLAGLCVLGTLAASTLHPAAGIGTFFATFIAFTAFCKFCEANTQAREKRDTGRDLESSGMLYPLFPIADVVLTFTRPGRLEKLVSEQKKGVEVNYDEAEKYINEAYTALSEQLDKEIRENESSYRGFMRLKVKPATGEKEFTDKISQLKLARAELETYRNFFSDLKGTATGDTAAAA